MNIIGNRKFILFNILGSKAIDYKEILKYIIDNFNVNEIDFKS